MKCDSLEGSDGENLSTVQQKNAGVTNLVDYYQLAVKDLKLSQLRLLHVGFYLCLKCACYLNF